MAATSLTARAVRPMECLPVTSGGGLSDTGRLCQRVPLQTRAWCTYADRHGRDRVVDWFQCSQRREQFFGDRLLAEVKRLDDRERSAADVLGDLGIGGRLRNRPTVVSSSGTRSLCVSSRHACMTSSPRSIGYHRIPA
jgi:hypothetical protein